MSPATYTLLAANVVAYLLELSLGPDWSIYRYALWPLGPRFHLFQLIGCGFLHANALHLATNMLCLWMFGRDCERELGTWRFTLLYTVSLLFASLTQVIVTTLSHDREPTVGASGAIFGVLAAFAILFPRRIIMFMFPPIPLPAPLFVVLYALFELFSGVSGRQAGIAHFAHLGGLTGGFLAARHWGRPRSRRDTR